MLPPYVRSDWTEVKQSIDTGQEPDDRQRAVAPSLLKMKY